jgi:hypothetical protein
MSEQAGVLIENDAATGGLRVRFPGWPAFRLRGLQPALRCDGQALACTSWTFSHHQVGAMLRARYEFAGGLRLALEFILLDDATLRFNATLHNTSACAVVLNEVALLRAESAQAAISFGANPAQICALEQGNYWGRVRSLAAEPGDTPNGTAGEPNSVVATRESGSELVSLVYDRAAGMAFLAGFLTSDRWLGKIHFNVQPDGAITYWNIGFDGGDLQVAAGQEIALESVMLAFGADPWALLERYGEASAQSSPPSLPERPPVSWCSWYPYRLSVSEERILRTAEIAAQRLAPLGLSIIETDLGWEVGNLPSTFEENERFPHGLKWLADKVGALGLDLGVWKAPYTISEFDPLSREHPEWLVQGEDGQPFAYWEWFWEPHGKVFILDLTHPGARTWLREKMAGLNARGIRYFKADFIGCEVVNQAKRRYDDTIVAGGGCEASRLGAQVIREAMPQALLLNCGGPEMPGSGAWPLLYICNDTGNTGYISHSAQQMNYQTVACHLWKNRRWGVVQPSCLCVGLPGTLEDARQRATVAFMTGGQVDISDDLTTLPEDRWAVLEATLPPLGITAKPIDLFEPVYEGGLDDYEAVCRGLAGESAAPREQPAGSVWQVHVATDWDEWDLVGIFCYAEGTSAVSPQLSSYAIPFVRLGIPADETRLAFEFWSGQYVGTVPGARVNAGGYRHPGDYQELRCGGRSGVLEVAFFGPAVKLLCLRRPRTHPWVAGTSFHQSCGAELSGVAWDADAATLRGIICRPAGEQGSITLVANGMKAVDARVDGLPVVLKPGAQDSLVLPVLMRGDRMAWQVRFA